MAENTEVVHSQEPKAEEIPQSLHERMEKSVADKWQSAATESAAAAAPAAEETPKAEPDGSESSAAETTQNESEKPQVTPEQLADKKFWGGLDKAGWERMEKHFPVETAHVKAAQAAATRIVNEARKETPKPAEERTDAPKQQLSPELQQAFRKMQSLDETEALEGFREMQRITLRESLPEFGLDPDRAAAEKVAINAYAIAAKALPELDSLDLNALDAVVESDPVLVALVKTANVDNVAIAMQAAGRQLLAKQKADSDKAAADKAAKDREKAEKQAKLRSNASIPGSVIAEAPGGATSKAKPSMEEFVANEWNKEAARATAT